MKFIRAFALTFLLSLQIFATLVDVENDYLADFVLETKKISVPGFPYAFNPSLVRWQGQLLLCFRAGKEYSYSEAEESSYYGSFLDLPLECPPYSPNRIGLVFLDDSLNIKGIPFILKVPNENATYRQQDPRLVIVKDKLHIVYSDIIKEKTPEETRRVCLGEVTYDGHAFFLENPVCLKEFEGVNAKRIEKNWPPFDYKGNLLLSYFINPHRVLYPIPGTEKCETIASSFAKFNWEWGELRGGTPAILEGNEYLSFFHSVKVMPSVQSGGKTLMHYFMGAYTYASEPPFSLTRISPQPIAGKNFYNGDDYRTWKPLKVVWPAGIVNEGKTLWLAYGRQDHEIWIAKIDKKGLYDSLIPTSPTQ